VEDELDADQVELHLRPPQLLTHTHARAVGRDKLGGEHVLRVAVTLVTLPHLVVAAATLLHRGLSNVDTHQVTNVGLAPLEQVPAFPAAHVQHGRPILAHVVVHQSTVELPDQHALDPVVEVA